MVKDLPPEAVEGIDDLPALLSRKIPLSAYSVMAVEVQRGVLGLILGEASPLISLLIENAKVN